MKHRLNTAFAGKADADLLAKGGAILKGLAKIWEGKELPGFVPTLAQLQEGLDKYHNAYDAAINRDIVKIAERKQARGEFVRLLESAAQYVEASAGDDDNTLRNSGFDLRKGGASRAPRTIPAAPANFVIQQGERRGSLIGKVARQPDAVCYELHFTEGDPTVEGNWKFLGVHVRPSPIVINDLEPGKQCSFRLRAHNGQGEGPWSQPVSVIPT